MTKISPYIWHLWASTERQSGVTKTGFYSIQPFAKQYRSSNVHSDDERTDPPSDQEILIASEIASAVSRLRMAYPDQAQALTLYHGAYPAAEAVRKDRLAKMKAKKRRIYELKDKAETYVQCWIDIKVERVA